MSRTKIKTTQDLSVRTYSHPCGCLSSREHLDPRHTIHYAPGDADHFIDKKLATEGLHLLLEARQAHRRAILVMDYKSLTCIRKAYKEAAKALAKSNDIVGARIADSYDSTIDWDIKMLSTLNKNELEIIYCIPSDD
jgi:hypothetical protein